MISIITIINGTILSLHPFNPVEVLYMKKLMFVLPIAFLTASFCSCEHESESESSMRPFYGEAEFGFEVEKSEEDNIVFDDKEGIAYTAEMIENFKGNTEEIDYNTIFEYENFGYMFSSAVYMCESENPAVAKPFKRVVVSDNVEPFLMNQWIFPIVEDESVNRFVFADCRFENIGDYIFEGEFCADGVNAALEKGSFVMFYPIDSEDEYAIFEDNEIMKIMGDPTEEYNGPEVSFEELAALGSVITPDMLNEVVYTMDSLSADMEDDVVVNEEVIIGDDEINADNESNDVIYFTANDN